MMMMSIDMFWSSLLISDLEIEIKTLTEAMDGVDLEDDFAIGT